MAAAQRLPVTIVGGYLGAGKTTLVNHILRNAAGRRIAVLVNDFGEVAIDADLIEARSDEVISIAGGCICCSYGSSLTDALERLGLLQPAPEWVIVEASGVGLPGSIASAVTLLQPYRVDGIVTLCNAETVRDQTRDKFLSDTVLLQLAQADLVVINKVDLAEATQLDSLESWLQSCAPGARLLRAVSARIPIDALHGAINDWSGATADHDAHATRYATTQVDVPFRVHPEDLASHLCRPELGLLRAKGFVQDAAGRMLQVHVVGSRWHIDHAPVRVTSPGQLVTIGRAGSASQSDIEAIVSRCRVTASS